MNSTIIIMLTLLIAVELILLIAAVHSLITKDRKIALAVFHALILAPSVILLFSYGFIPRALTEYFGGSYFEVNLKAFLCILIGLFVSDAVIYAWKKTKNKNHGIYNLHRPQSR